MVAFAWHTPYFYDSSDRLSHHVRGQNFAEFLHVDVGKVLAVNFKYVSSSQIVAALPELLPIGNVSVSVWSDGLRTSVGRAYIISAFPRTPILDG